MPRRRPAAVRAALKLHPRRNPCFSVIDALSSAALAEIRQWERARGQPGRVALDLAWWRGEVRGMSGRRWHGIGAGGPYYGYFNCACCQPYAPDGRWGLEAGLSALPRRARRELAAVVAAVDARLLAATYGGEPDAPGWWAERM